MKHVARSSVIRYVSSVVGYSATTAGRSLVLP
jgi:hypothetical protein